MSRKIFKCIFGALILTGALLFSSCSKIMGYSVVLWNISDYEIADGSIVTVYVKSNVSHVYIIGLPGTEEKIEVPLWQISEPDKLKETQKLAAKYQEYEHQYARCVLDGLPIRADRVNTSKQVYRLRKGEVIKVLYESDGAAVMSGKNAMEGKWLRVITNEGTSGWCFSYNLRLFEMNADGTAAGGNDETVEEQKDTYLELLFNKRWYPENYNTMIKRGNIDFELMNLSYGFMIDRQNDKIMMKIPNLTVEKEYSGISKPEEFVYKFNDSPFQVTVRNSKFIVVQYTDENGKPVSYNFIYTDSDIDKVLSNERERRSTVYKTLCSAGPDFKSSNYGTLTFEDDNYFKWTNYRLLVPSVIPSTAGREGTVELKYFLSNELKKSWDGVVTLNFEGMDSEINFLYKLEKNGLRFEDATKAGMKGNVINSRAPNSIVVFFAK